MPSVYPLRFEPIFKSMLWGGQRLPSLLRRNWSAQQPVGEAWLISDIPGYTSVVSNGHWKGATLRELVQRETDRILGQQQQQWKKSGRFPLLLKLIDAQQELSVQVHPDDECAARLGAGPCGKTEAWVVLDRHPQRSRIYAGLHSGVTEASFRHALQEGRVAETLHSFVPQVGDCLFLPAGTVHALGAELLVFEIQQTSDVTYRLYDWDRVDPATGQPRALQVEQALACIDWSRGPCQPVQPAVIMHGTLRCEGLIQCSYFTLERLTLFGPTTVGKPGRCHILVICQGTAILECGGQTESVTAGDVLLIPAAIGLVQLAPLSEPLIVLDCGLGEGTPG